MGAPISRAVVAVSLLVAAVLGLTVGGLTGGDDGGSDGASSTASTAGNGDPSTSPDEQSSGDGSDQSASGLTLNAGSPSIGANQRFDLTGAVSPAQAGVTVRLERRVNGGDWSPFPNVSPKGTKDDGSFSFSVQSGQKGTNEFRVLAEVDGEQVESDPVPVEIT